MKKRSWAIWVALVILGGGILSLLIGREPMHEGWCQLHRKASDSPSESALITLASQALTPLPSAPSDLADLPETFTKPCFYRMQAGANTLTLVIDLADKPILCVDTDGDGSLSDERQFPVESVKEAGQKRDRFGPIRVAPDSGDNQASAAFYAVIYRRDKAGPIWLYPTHYRYGKLRMGQSIYKIAVVDGDYDGQFDSVVSLPVDNPWNLPHSDAFAIDYDRNGEFRRSDYTRSEVMPLGRMIQLHNRYYVVNVATDGNRLDLEEVEPEQGKLAIAPPQRQGRIATLVRRG